ncbi:hypothetical protein StoSoilB13_12540 [Arthrobacter sp. StoSoilB13]|nr:hypothetical protein StoSoilB13_12540 [Arthrobacter sp. StoSoilB13]
MPVNATMNTSASTHTGITGQTVKSRPCRAKGFGCDDHHQLQPPEPANGAAGGLAHGFFGVDGECSAVGVCGSHLAQGPHDQDDQGTRYEVGDQDRRSGGLDACAGAEEEACSDGASEPHHGELAWLK